MTLIDWQRLINETADLAVPMVQLIGGEPTLHPDLPQLVRHALGRGLQVEVFSNLVRVSDRLWEVFELPGVRLATSYYSPHASEHDSVTGRRSHDRTLDNIRSALERRIPLRVGVIDLGAPQDVDGAVDELTALGVHDITVDGKRGIGRAASTRPGIDQLCGRCGDGQLAVLPSGAVTPCTLARWLVMGSVHEMSLADVYAGSAPARTALQHTFGKPKPPPAPPKPKPDGAPCVAPLRCAPQVGPRK